MFVKSGMLFASRAYGALEGPLRELELLKLKGGGEGSGKLSPSAASRVLGRSSDERVRLRRAPMDTALRDDVDERAAAAELATTSGEECDLAGSW